MAREFRIIFCLVAAVFGLTGLFAQDQARSTLTASVDHSMFDALLKDHVQDGRVDYAGLKSDVRLADYLALMADVDLNVLSRDERLVYWINTYNAVTLKLMAGAWPVESIMKLNGGKPWDVPLFRPRGARAAITLNHLEHGIIRKEFDEPRIHFALVCAAVSCPPLIPEAYVAEKLETQLAVQTQSFLRDPAHNVYDQGQHTLRLSPLFQWYAGDFGGEANVLAFVLPYLTSSDQRALRNKSAPPALVFGDYDWSPNAKE